MSHTNAVVALTDKAWFDHFRPTDELTIVDEVNFWQPLTQHAFRALDAGGPFFFRLKAPINAIVGFGFFAVQSALPVDVAWDVFGWKNGCPRHTRFVDRIRRFRERHGGRGSETADLSCLVLREANFLPERSWLQWGDAQSWARDIVSYKSYNLNEGPGRFLANLIAQTHSEQLEDFAEEFVPLEIDERVGVERSSVDRQGQGAFQLRVMAAYDGRCAVTTGHPRPVLDAAHIQPYLGPASNHVQNGLLLRTDLHRLFDAGYITVTTDMKLEVSRRLKDEFDNGRQYYRLHGKRLLIPSEPSRRPSVPALRWHSENVFR